MKKMIKDELNKGITQRDLAKRIGVSHGTIQKILFTDTKYTYETRKKVADYFRVPVAHFYDAPESAPSPTQHAAPTDHRLEDLKNSIIRLHEINAEMHRTIIDLGAEIGKIKDRMLDAAETGDVHRLRLVVRSEKK